MVDQGLYVGEDTLGVGFVTHDHHVLHFQQRHAVGVRPEEETCETACMREADQETGWEWTTEGVQKKMFSSDLQITIFSHDYS